MINHVLNHEVALKCGSNAGILFKHIGYWVKINEEKKHNLRFGKFWMYNSVKEFAKEFDYMSEKQIRTALKKLEEEGYIISGVYNKCPCDRTKWYTLTEMGENAYMNENEKEKINIKSSVDVKISQGQMQMLEKENASAQNGKKQASDRSEQYQKNNTIKDPCEYTLSYKAQLKASQVSVQTDIHSKFSKKTTVEDVRSAYPEEFERLWCIYPKQQAKREAYKAWISINPDNDLQDLMYDKVLDFKKTQLWTRENGRYVPLLGRWLLAEGWSDEVPREAVTPTKNCYKSYIKHNYTEEMLAHIGMNFDDDD